MMNLNFVLIAGSLHRQGGMDKANLELALYLASTGAQVHVVTHHAAQELFGTENITVHIAPLPKGSFLLGEFILGRKARAVIDSLRAQNVKPYVIANGGNFPQSDINWVHAFHHAWETSDAHAPAWFRLKNRLAKHLARRSEAKALRNSRLIIANSERTRQDILKHLSIAPAAVHTVYMGTENRFHQISPAERSASRAIYGIYDSQPVILFVGALSHDTNKGIDTLLNALARVKNAHLMVAGGGGGEVAAKGEAVRLGLDGRVQFLGRVNDVENLIAACDLVVSPSRYEAYGLMVHETIARGVPAIVSRSAGIAERYPEDLQDFLLNDSNSAEELALRLESWLRSIDTARDRFQPFARKLRAASWASACETIFQLAGQAFQKEEQWESLKATFQL